VLDQQVTSSQDQSILGTALALSGPTVVLFIVSVVLAVLLVRTRQKLRKLSTLHNGQARADGDGEQLQARDLGAVSQPIQ
jgi:hypothetical protein